VIEVGLTGGIGAGKSSVSERLVSRGAKLVDADAIVRDVQGGGGPVVAAMAERWGSGILLDDGELNRQAVADIVFKDPEELEALSAIVNPAVVEAMARQRKALQSSDAVIVLDIPLLVESGHGDLAGIIVVDVDPEVAVARLVEFRGFSESDARARMANQISREERLKVADFVVDNSGDLDDLEVEADRCWDWLASLS
jgi:dephospho-CoA kinase